MPTKFAHTNLVASDWRNLSNFYQEVFGMEPVLPERDLKGRWLDKATGIENAHIRGVHLRLPGPWGNGPTLEIFQYDTMPEHHAVAPNTPGFCHIAFAVDNVAEMAERVFNKGGTAVGDLTIHEFPGVGMLTFQYVTDPEGNIIELQNWKQTTS